MLNSGKEGIERVIQLPVQSVCRCDVSTVPTVVRSEYVLVDRSRTVVPVLPTTDGWQCILSFPVEPLPALWKVGECLGVGAPYPYPLRSTEYKVGIYK